MKYIYVFFVYLFVFCSPAFAEQTATTEDGKKVILKDDKTWEFIKSEKETKKVQSNAKDGFKNIMLGMTKDEVRTTVKKDDSLKEMIPDKVYETKIGNYNIWVVLIYDNHNILYCIELNSLDSVNASKIDPFIHNQVEYFYDIFYQKYGKPSFKRFDNVSKINIFTFQDNYYVHIYQWQIDGITRSISLSRNEFKHKAIILITNDTLEKTKAKEDKAKVDNEKNKSKDDFK